MGKFVPVYLSNEDVQEVATFLGLDFDFCKQRIVNYDSKELANFWRQIDPNSEGEINKFYSQIEHYIFGLTQANSSLEREKFHGKVIDYLLKNYPPSRYPKVLDYGSGVGADLIKFGEKGYRISFADIPGKTAEFTKYHLAKRKINAEFFSINGNPPFIKRNFDLIICFDVLEHVPKPVDVLYLLCRHLSTKGAIAIINCPNDDGDHPCHLSHTFSILGKNWPQTLDRVGLIPVKDCDYVYRKPNILKNFTLRLRYLIWAITSLYIIRVPR